MQDDPKQHGVALITVLLILAILTALITRMAFSNRVWIRQVENNAEQIRSSQAMRAAQRWITLMLEKDTTKFDGGTDFWAQPLPPIPLGEGMLYGNIEDLQARFNLNDLVTENGKSNVIAVERFTRLLQVLNLNPGIVQAVVDWIDPDDIQAGAWGAEDSFYYSLDPPYLCANKPFTNVAELRLVRGVDDDAWHKLEPFVTALPQVTPININTISPELLAAVMVNWGPPVNSLGRARSWVWEAQADPASSLDEFTRRIHFGADKELPDSLAVNSQYFMAHIRLDYGNVEQRVSTVYYRMNNGRTIILGQSREFQ